jgi:nitroimidazol reductase NimA-like FMN-containing flavoprotein (pyridoxamine 5'-phosphate oxidase superfamily)
MRRNEFSISDMKEIDAFLLSEFTGVLSMIDTDGLPYALPMSYVYLDGVVCIHGALQGKKSDCIRAHRKVQFTVYREYSYIPSYATGGKSACSASSFYKSVIISGSAVFIDSVDEKIHILTGMMKTFQPEGNHEPFCLSGENEKIMAGVALMKIIPDEISAKFKFGQHLSDEKIGMIMNVLEKRGDPIDIETVKYVKRYRGIKK